MCVSSICGQLTKIGEFPYFYFHLGSALFSFSLAINGRPGLSAQPFQRHPQRTASLGCAENSDCPVDDARCDLFGLLLYVLPKSHRGLPLLLSFRFDGCCFQQANTSFCACDDRLDHRPYASHTPTVTAALRSLRKHTHLRFCASHRTHPRHIHTMGFQHLAVIEKMLLMAMQKSFELFPILTSRANDVNSVSNRAPHETDRAYTRNGEYTIHIRQSILLHLH